MLGLFDIADVYFQIALTNLKIEETTTITSFKLTNML